MNRQAIAFRLQAPIPCDERGGLEAELRRYIYVGPGALRELVLPLEGRPDTFVGYVLASLGMPATPMLRIPCLSNRPVPSNCIVSENSPTGFATAPPIVNT